VLSAEALAESGSIALHFGHAGEAETRLHQAEQHYRRAGAGGMPLIRLYDSLSGLADGRGDAKGALHYAQSGLAERLATFAPEDEKVAVGYNNLGFALDSTGDFAGAIDAYRRAHAIHQQRIGADAFETAIPLMGLGADEALGGQVRQGREDILQARAIFAMATGKPRQDQVRVARHLCAVETAMSSADAPASCDEALRLSEAVFGKANPNYAVALRARGALHIERGDFTAARSDLGASLDALATGAPKSWRGRSEMTLGELELLEGHGDEAVRILQSGLEAFGDGYPITSRFDTLAFLALACSESKAVACEAGAYEKASDTIAGRDYAWSAVLLRAHTALARVELHDGKPDSAVGRLRQAIDHARSEVASTSPRLAASRLWLAIALARSGDCEGARATIDAVHAMPERAGASSASDLDGHPLLKAARTALAAERACALSTSY
jgi:serine/threonine-protein kinase